MTAFIARPRREHRRRQPAVPLRGVVAGCRLREENRNRSKACTIGWEVAVARVGRAREGPSRGRGVQLLLSKYVSGLGNLLDEGLELYRTIRTVQRVSLIAYRGGAAVRACETIPQALYRAADSLRRERKRRGAQQVEILCWC